MAVSISVDRLAKFADPMGAHSAWGGPVTRACVASALCECRLAPLPGGSDHAARIAYLVINPAVDPIQLDVGIPSHTGPAWPIEDGNHRVAAAIFRGDLTISAEIAGCLDHIAELFELSEDELDML